MKYNCVLLFALCIAACQTSPSPKASRFSADLDFLKKHDSVIVLAQGQSQVIISPKYQGKVFTSTADGNGSFGWINYKAFDAAPDPHMNAYGGENRLWLGPEGNRFSLFFGKGKPQTFENWKTPAAFDNEPWTVASANAGNVALTKNMQLVNYAGTVLELAVSRKISILGPAEINSLIRDSIDNKVIAVAYETKNSIQNTGSNAWDSATGAPCLWLLDMFSPSDQSTVVIPYKDRPGAVTADYFGQVPPARLRGESGLLFFKTDGKQRGKLGISSTAASNIAGSFDARNNILTLVFFDVSPAAPYLNQQWNTTRPAYQGDAVNAYNDGPLADGGQMGPFYELESVSPAAFLKPGEQLTHTHTVLHLSGDNRQLDKIAKALLGVDLAGIKAALK